MPGRAIPLPCVVALVHKHREKLQKLIDMVELDRLPGPFHPPADILQHLEGHLNRLMLAFSSSIGFMTVLLLHISYISPHSPAIGPGIDPPAVQSLPGGFLSVPAFGHVSDDGGYPFNPPVLV